MRHFLIDTVLNISDYFIITGTEANHISNVLRKKPKDIIGLSDKKGFFYRAVIEKISKKRVEVAITEKFSSKSEPKIGITLCQAFLKAKKMEKTICSLTELGITAWIPFLSERSVSHPDKEKIKSRIARWKKIADESVKQSKRAKPPLIYPLLSFEETLQTSSLTRCKKIIFYEKTGADFSMDKIGYINYDNKNIFVLIGPEGGFTEKEVDLAEKAGFLQIGLGPRILKSETAAIAVVSIIQFLYGDMKSG